MLDNETNNDGIIESNAAADSAEYDVNVPPDPNAPPEINDGEVVAAPAPAKMELYDWLQCIVSAVVCGIFIFIFIGRVIGVEMTSMLPTLCNNDRVIMSNLFYKPENGDIVIFRTEVFGDTPLVKRIIATEGQVIDINFETGDVTVDGVVLDEPYIYAPTNVQKDFSGPTVVPEGHVFVMGDNRNASTDSRDGRIGMVDTRSILGKVLLVILPGRGEDNVRDWSRLGSVYS